MNGHLFDALTHYQFVGIIDVSTDYEHSLMSDIYFNNSISKSITWITVKLFMRFMSSLCSCKGVIICTFFKDRRVCECNGMETILHNWIDSHSISKKYWNIYTRAIKAISLFPIDEDRDHCYNEHYHEILVINRRSTHSRTIGIRDWFGIAEMSFTIGEWPSGIFNESFIVNANLSFISPSSNVRKANRLTHFHVCMTWWRVSAA